MRPLRFVLLLFCFVVVPIFLTCLSFLSGSDESPSTFDYRRQSRLRALFSFTTPSALFPPSAIISLTADNSTFFLARPAAFGPSLPSKGLSGRLWVGKGFGDDTLLSDENLKISGFELGCSDVPGWGHDQQNTPDNPAVNDKSFKKNKVEKATNSQTGSQEASDLNKRGDVSTEESETANNDDGTDDHLHHPLHDSNPANPNEPGEPAKAVVQDKSRKPTHADIESLQESADIAGKVVLLSRGGCGFLEKVKWAQRRGGIGLIVGDNERNGQLTIMYAKGDTSNVTIPAIFTSYTSAHLLSSLVPAEKHEISAVDSSKSSANLGKENSDDNANAKVNKPVDGPIFTSTSIAKNKPTNAAVHDGSSQETREDGWMQKAMQAVGFDDSAIHAEDSRRPPGSGNIRWMQVKDWEEDDQKTTSTSSSTTKNAPTSSRISKKATSTHKTANDDFVIGVQDWRDTELIAPKSTSTGPGKGKGEEVRTQTSSTTIGHDPLETALKGGSIIPGSGEYVDAHEQQNSRESKDKSHNLRPHHSSHHTHNCFIERIKKVFGYGEDKSSTKGENESSSSADQQLRDQQKNGKGDKDHQEGLWVTLTPTSVSTSPFFDTLLVLVISPLVTLTFVYGLLLLRSRIRRRRWRAPKSVVEQLPVRTYQTMSDSSTTSSQFSSPDRSATESPMLRPDPIRARQRSQTTTGVVSPASSHSQSPPAEKPSSKTRFKRYRGRQVECVVCLEEYVDGESKVMSLPCGHEFHVDCITPWLVNRRRTCPICKGDVVRSLQRGAQGHSSEEDGREPGEETSDDVQERVATTVADDGSAAIPIPERQDIPNVMDNDIERGHEEELVTTTEDGAVQQQNQPIASRWRGILNASVSTLSGDTLWRTNSVDRNR